MSHKRISVTPLRQHSDSPDTENNSKEKPEWSVGGLCVHTGMCVLPVGGAMSQPAFIISHTHTHRFSSGMHNLFKGHVSYPGRLWPAQPGGRSRTTPMTTSPWVWRESMFAAGRRRCGVATWSWCRDGCTSLRTQQETHSDGVKHWKIHQGKKNTDTKHQHSHEG